MKDSVFSDDEKNENSIHSNDFESDEKEETLNKKKKKSNTTIEKIKSGS